MTKNTIIVILLLLIGVLTGISYYQNVRINTYNKYSKNCEILLDSLSYWNNSFMDTIIETDTYYYYLNSKENLN